MTHHGNTFPIQKRNIHICIIDVTSFEIQYGSRDIVICACKSEHTRGGQDDGIIISNGI